MHDDAGIAPDAASRADASCSVLYVGAASALTDALAETDDLHVERPADPEAAVDAVRADPDGVDCVVTEYDLPGVTGIELLERVRAIEPGLPVVLVAADGSEAVASEAISAGVDDYVPKRGTAEGARTLRSSVENAIDRRRAERERERHLTAIETAAEGISILDADGRFRYVNEAYARLYGYEPDELVGESWERLYRPEDASRVREEILPTVYETGRWSGYTTGLRADGSTFVEDHDLAVTADDTLVCTVRDVDARRAEGAAVEERLLLDRALDLLPDIVYVLDPDGTLSWYNDRLPDATGYAPAELDAMSAVELFPPTERDRVRTAIETVRSTGSEVIETEIRTADGECVPYELTGDLVTDGGDPAAIVGVGRDISSHRERERTLRALNETSQELMGAETEQAVADRGVRAAQEVVGLAATAIHRYDEAADGLVPVAQTDPGASILADPPTLEAGESIAWRVYASGEPYATGDVSADPDAANPETPIESEVILPLGDHGVLIAASETPRAFDDEDVVLGEILAGSIEAAFDAVDRTAELAARERELADRNERLEEFASVVSHDLRNPLQVARGHLDRISASADRADALEQATEALDHMDALVDDLLTLSRQGESIGDREPVVLDHLALQCWRTIDAAAATLRRESERAVMADRRRLRQLLENLLANAVVHGGPDVTVTVGARPGGFYVADDGPGIPPDERATIFETGYTTADDGTGFGLGIVTRVAEAHGWSVEVGESEDGGARFDVTGVEIVG
ncbi:PAS domain S-box protein [Halovivax limisalsi]|uniref:PAS domain S-box protein n=1 Tax=Halovivax limisalsi TaxID=1453760 RepID=UPI001FFCEA83|nr:PAS domain S-box protein [Halovivax limisalsi]